jgi:DNA-binding CsgD family transcriptional regulator
MDHSTIQSYPELSIGANGLYPSEPLTAQEIEILRLLAERRKNAEIADKLYISVSTVKWHLWNIYRKMGVRNRRGAVDLAQNIGLIPK